MRPLTGMFAALYLLARRLGVRGVPWLCGRALYQVMRLRSRQLRAASGAPSTTSNEATPSASFDSVRIAGITWSVPLDDRKPGSLSDRLLRGDLPIGELLRTRRFIHGGVMIDIGANIGTTAIPRLLLGDVERVYGVEPDPTNHAALQRTIAANGLTAYVHVDRAALGAADGEADLLVASRLGRHRLLPEGATKRATIRVPARRLDTWSARLGADLERVRYVKCDTQGWEAHIFAGAPGLLARRAIVWEIEICPPLLEAAGSGVDELCATLVRHFEWFVDLRADDETLDQRPIGELAAAVRAAVAGPRNYTNVILGNDPER
jgi:FkbM family methyltransferase